MHENFSVFKKNAFRSRVRWCSGKVKPCRYFCDITCHTFCSYSRQVVNCSTLCHKLDGDYYRESQDCPSNLKNVKWLHENCLSGSTEC